MKLRIPFVKSILRQAATLWLIFTSITAHTETLLQVYEQALKNDPTWTAQREAYFADAEAKTAARAGLLPQIYGGISYSNVQYGTSNTSQITTLAQIGNATLTDTLECVNQYGLSDINPLVNCLTNRTKKTSSSAFSTTSFSVNLTQPLFRLDRWYQYQQGQLVTDKARLDFIKAQQDLIMKVAELYFSALRAQDEASFSHVTQTSITRQLHDAQTLFERGQLQSTQVYQAQAAYDLSQTAKIIAEGAYQATLETLEGLTHNPNIDVTALPPDVPIELPQPSNPALWVQMAKTRNLDLQSLRLAARIAHTDYEVKQSAHAPTVDFFASHSQTQSNGLTSVLNQGETTTTSLGVNLNIPIYTGGLTSSLARQAKHHERQAEALSEAMEQQVTLSTRRFYRNVVTHIQHIEAQKIALLSREKVLLSVRNEYQRGQRSITEVLQTQQDLFSAQKDLANARYDYILDTLRLKQSAGVLSFNDLKALNTWFGDFSATSSIQDEQSTFHDDQPVFSHPIIPAAASKNALPSLTTTDDEETTELPRPTNLVEAIRRLFNH